MVGECARPNGRATCYGNVSFRGEQTGGKRDEVVYFRMRRVFWAILSRGRATERPLPAEHAGLMFPMVRLPETDQFKESQCLAESAVRTLPRIRSNLTHCNLSATHSRFALRSNNARTCPAFITEEPETQ